MRNVPTRQNRNNPTAPATLTREQQLEIARCWDSPYYFINNYGVVEDTSNPDGGRWVPFKLWDMQGLALDLIHEEDEVIILKARQLGITWLVLWYILWRMMFRPRVIALLYSRRELDAHNLIGMRLKPMFQQLPAFLRGGLERYGLADNKGEWELGNGSIAMAFAPVVGDSYTSSIVFADEADLMDSLNYLLRAVKPTMAAGGKFIMISRVDKDKPNSEFKRIYRGAKAKTTSWRTIFLPWYARPTRTRAWRDKQAKEIKERTGALDELFEQYPETDAEALAPPTLSKRIPPDWLAENHTYFYEEGFTTFAGMPAVPGLVIYRPPVFGIRYVAGADPAEGNPNSDDSSCIWMDRNTGEEVAKLTGKIEPSIFASYIAQVCQWYNYADVLPERNNHGHTVILWLEDNAPYVSILPGLDEKPGWQTNSKSKAMMYTDVAEGCRDQMCIIHGMEVWFQLSSIDTNKLEAPEGMMDDLATAFSLAYIACSIEPVGGIPLRQVTVGGGVKGWTNKKKR